MTLLTDYFLVCNSCNNGLHPQDSVSISLGWGQASVFLKTGESDVHRNADLDHLPTQGRNVSYTRPWQNDYLASP